MDPKKILPIILAAIIILGVTGAAGYFYYQYRQSQEEIRALREDPQSLQKAASDEARKLVQEVGALIDLPTNEEPTIATVSDKEKLQDQAFFSKAKNGDKVLIYTNAKKAFLYDPKARKVIDVAPVNIGSESATAAGTESSKTEQESTEETGSGAKIILLNGTKTVGLTTRLEGTVKKSLPEAEIAGKDNAGKNDYDRTIVVVLNDAYKTAGSNLAKALKGGVESIPAGEEKPANADIVVIFGRDQL